MPSDLAVIVAVGAAVLAAVLLSVVRQRGQARYLDAELLLSATGLRNVYAGQLRVTNRVDATLVIDELRLQAPRGAWIVNYAWAPHADDGLPGRTPASSATLDDHRPIEPGGAEILRFMIRSDDDRPRARVSCRTKLRYALADNPRRAGRRHLKAGCLSPFTNLRF